MSTIRLYYSDPSLFSFKATATERRSVGGRTAVVLDRTAFYPEGGGQPCDLGTIAGVPVLDVMEDDGTVLHVVGGEVPVPAGVDCAVDAARRRDHAEQHSGQHLLSAVFSRLLSAPTVGFHLGEDYSTIDLATNALGDSELAAATAEVDRLIASDLRIITHECDREAALKLPLRKAPPAGEDRLRILEIDGFDWSPCCGTHLPSTLGIRTLSVLKVEKRKDCQRVFFVAGGRAIADRARLAATVAEAARVFGCSGPEVAEKARAASARISALEADLKRVRADRADAEAALAKLDGTVDVLDRRWTDRPFDEALESAKALVARGIGIVVCSTALEPKVGAVAAKADAALAAKLKPLVETSGGKGGGGPTLFQASFPDAEGAAAFARGAVETLAAGGNT